MTLLFTEKSMTRLIMPLTFVLGGADRGRRRRRLGLRRRSWRDLRLQRRQYRRR